MNSHRQPARHREPNDSPRWLQSSLAPIAGICNRLTGALLDSSPQPSLLPLGDSELYVERHFLSGPRSIRNLRRRTLILFYESGTGGGRQAVVAVARVTDVYLKRRDSLDVSQLRQSVLTPTSLASLGSSKVKTVTAFDNIFKLPRPVSLKRLKALDLGRPNDLITTRPITDDQLQAILNDGFSNV